MVGGRSGSFADLNNSDFGLSSKSFTGRDLFPTPRELMRFFVRVIKTDRLTILLCPSAAPRTRHSFGGKSLNEEGGKQFGLSEYSFYLFRVQSCGFG